MNYVYPLELTGSRVSYDLLERLDQDRSIVDPSARISGAVGYLGNIAGIGPKVLIEDGANVGHGVWLGEGSVLESGAVVDNDCYFGKNVRITADITICSDAYFADNSGVQSSPTRADSRMIESFATIGEGVLLPDEVQLGKRTMIPTQESITQIGRYGESQRMITIYGGPRNSPRLSVGCQFGITLQTFKNRVKKATGTSSASAEDYYDHMPEIVDATRQVQAAYNRSRHIVAALRTQRHRAFRSLHVTTDYYDYD